MYDSGIQVLPHIISPEAQLTERAKRKGLGEVVAVVVAMRVRRGRRGRIVVVWKELFL